MKKPLTPVQAVLYGGLTVGVLDILEAIVFWAFRGVAPARVFQGIASGLLGPQAFSGGIPTVLLGAILHFFIAFTVVKVYFLVSERLTALRLRPWVWGPLYGVAVYLVMYLVVLPLSATAPPRFAPLNVANGLFAHIFFVGLPAALFARAAVADRPATT
jgi:hypothetical protein